MKTTLSLVSLLIAMCWTPSAWSGERIEVNQVLITLIEEVDVPAREAGVLADVAVKEGQLVNRGDRLAQISDTEVKLIETKAKVELEIARKEADNALRIQFAEKASEVAQKELDRANESIQRYRKSVSDTDLDRLKLTAQEFTLKLKQAHHDLESAQLTAAMREIELELATRSVERRRIFSPLDGVVVQIKRRRGEWVQPGETVARILRIDRLRVECFLDAKTATHELTGRRVTVRLAVAGNPSAEFRGEVVFVHPEVDAVNGQIRVWAEIDNPDRLLRPGQKGSMTIETTSPARNVKRAG